MDIGHHGHSAGLGAGPQALDLAPPRQQHGDQKHGQHDQDGLPELPFGALHDPDEAEGDHDQGPARMVKAAQGATFQQCFGNGTLAMGTVGLGGFGHLSSIHPETRQKQDQNGQQLEAPPITCQKKGNHFATSFSAQNCQPGR